MRRELNSPRISFSAHRKGHRRSLQLMRVVVLSAGTGEVVWDHTSALFRQMRGWAFRGMLCEANCCSQYFSIILLVHQLLLYDMACLEDYAEGEVLTVYMLRRGIANPTDFNLQQATAALRNNDRARLWAVLSQGIHMRVLVPTTPTGVELISFSSPCNPEPPGARHTPRTGLAYYGPSVALGMLFIPADFGMPEVSPLWEALRMDDEEVVLLLLQIRASPSRRED